VEDHIGTAPNQGAGHPALSQVGDQHFQLEARSSGARSSHDIGERDVRDAYTTENAVTYEPFRELPPQHSRGTGDEDSHRHQP
jgi:hypothetical protein